MPDDAPTPGSLALEALQIQGWVSGTKVTVISGTSNPEVGPMCREIKIDFEYCHDCEAYHLTATGDDGDDLIYQLEMALEAMREVRTYGSSEFGRKQ